LNNNVHQDKGPGNGLIPVKDNKFAYVVAVVALGYVAPPCAAVDLGVEALVMSPGFASEQWIFSSFFSRFVVGSVFPTALVWGRQHRLRGIRYSRLLSPSSACDPVPASGL